MAAASQAYGRVERLILGQASVLAYIDVFRIMAVVRVLARALLFFCQKNKPAQGGAAAH